METGIPEDFINEMINTFGAEQAELLVKELDSEPVTSIRLNPLKTPAVSTPTNATPVPWCRDGWVLNERPQFTLIPEWHAGCFYVQEPSSMIIYEVVKRIASRFTKTDVRYLDLCAAPGGKTTAALSALPEQAFVVANEFVPSRAKILLENLCKWGAHNTAVTCGDTAAFRKLQDVFDIVAVDAPCSGEGMMRKDEEARRQWSVTLVQQCAELQREILRNGWTALRPGGYLIYSTCTFNGTENENTLLYAVDELGAESIDLGIASDFGLPYGLVPNLHAIRFMLHITTGEGLFLGVLRKPADEGDAPTCAKGKIRKSTPPLPDKIRNLLINSCDYDYEQTKESVWCAIPKIHSLLVSQLQKHSRLLSTGITLGETKGKDFVPDAALALSTAISPTAYPRCEVDKDTALCYLRRKALVLPPDTPRGFVIITYNGHCLGFVKNLGQRANNLYPQNWRIRHL